MRIFTKRNALLGWVAYRVARRKLDGRHPRRRGLVAGIGLAAGAGAAAALAFWLRRGHAEPARA